ncbi:anhydro-N-acetylmuramic acid kinase [Lichenicola sp.]|uniref:anhydro-N-acetylmuramic acid kinase n=1 Tax=Lichenicola sp. TaxID=2804529 RepID=UPI003AFFDB5C
MQRVIGLMSGTSLDGVDAALVETDGVHVGERGASITVPYDPDLRAALRRLLDRAADPAANLDDTDPELLRLERRLTDVHADAVAALGEPATLIGFHGQTILHRPRQRRTWQIGDAAYLAHRTGLPVAYDFRSADVAAGGEGAPLVPAYHAALAAGLDQPLVVLNIGGVANLTWIGPDALLACDTGPGNALLDDWAMRHTGTPCDIDGALAASGQVDQAILAGLLAHPFLRRPAPKSLDRLDFSGALHAVSGLSATDGAATLTAFTAAAVAATSLPERPTRWVVCGGGRHNPVLMRELNDRLGVPVVPVEALGWDGDALEAQCFAFLAARVEAGLPLSWPGTTGVPEPTPGGRLVTPSGLPLSF